MKNSNESKPSGDIESSEASETPAGLPRKSLVRHRPQPDAEPLPSAVAQLLSRRQVAQRWGCCEHTVARRRDLKPLRFNDRLLRYRLEDVEAVERAAAG
jgi:hypothetical protein